MEILKPKQKTKVKRLIESLKPMRLVAKGVLFICKKTLLQKPPSVEISTNYLRRWYVIPRNKFFNVYFHEFIGSDGRFLHDHPWLGASLILKGNYVEHTLYGSEQLEAGSFRAFAPTHFHRIEIFNPVFTLFITGPRVKKWGFLYEGQWIEHTKFLKFVQGLSDANDK